MKKNDDIVGNESSSLRDQQRQHDDGQEIITLVKIGGSSITHKGQMESLDADALQWFAKTISSSISDRFLAPSSASSSSSGGDHDNIHADRLNDETTTPKAKKMKTSKSPKLAFVILHGAGSFGHFQAKKFGLKGESKEPENNANTMSKERNRYRKHGMAATRLSVTKLNHLVVEMLCKHGINAVGISPFGIPGLEAHANLQKEPVEALQKQIRRTIQAGLVPVLHGDACLYGLQDVGILSGDTIMECIGKLVWIRHAIFITDVDGVFNEDPRTNPQAELLKQTSVNPKTGHITTNINASGSSHEHDVTGGLETKLKSAATIASSGKDVVIVKCQSSSAEQALKQGYSSETMSSEFIGTKISPKQRVVGTIPV